MVDEHGIAVKEVIADQDHLASGWRFDRGARRYSEIQTRVGIAFLAIKETANAELARKGSTHRLFQQQVARRPRREAAVSANLLGQFAIDTFQVGGVGIDLALVFQGDALFWVLLVADGEVQGACAIRGFGGDLLAAGLDRQRHTHNRQPARILFFDHQHRPALITGLRRLSAGTQIDDRNTARYRLVQQAGDVTVVAGMGGQGKTQCK